MTRDAKGAFRRVEIDAESAEIDIDILTRAGDQNAAIGQVLHIKNAGRIQHHRSFAQISLDGFVGPALFKKLAREIKMQI